MDKENECPKSKNATLSLFTVFYVGRKSGTFYYNCFKKLRFTLLNDVNEKRCKKNTVIYNCIFLLGDSRFLCFIFGCNDLSIAVYARQIRIK